MARKGRKNLQRSKSKIAAEEEKEKDVSSKRRRGENEEIIGMGEFNGTLLEIEKRGFDSQHEYYRAVGYYPRDIRGILSKEEKMAFQLVEENCFIPLSFHLAKIEFGPLSGTTGELRAIRAARLGLLPPRHSVLSIADTSCRQRGPYQSTDSTPVTVVVEGHSSLGNSTIGKRKRGTIQSADQEEGQTAGISTASGESVFLVSSGILVDEKKKGTSRKRQRSRTMRSEDNKSVFAADVSKAVLSDTMSSKYWVRGEEYPKKIDKSVIFEFLHPPYPPFIVCTSCGMEGHWLITCPVKQAILENTC